MTYPPIINGTVDCVACGASMMLLQESCPRCRSANPYNEVTARMMGSGLTNAEIVAKLEDPEFRESDDGLLAAVTAEADEVAEKKLEEELKIIKEAKSTGEWSEVGVDLINKYAADIVLTTALTVPGVKVTEVVEVISAECVYGMNIFRDVFAGFRDFFGGRSAATQNVLRDARRTALGELRREALILGADAVIAVDLDYQELSGGQKNGMLMLVASGTAVLVDTDVM